MTRTRPAKIVAILGTAAVFYAAFLDGGTHYLYDRFAGYSIGLANGYGTEHCSQDYSNDIKQMINAKTDKDGLVQADIAPGIKLQNDGMKLSWWLPWLYSKCVWYKGPRATEPM
jgi:hypothetical protein